MPIQTTYPFTHSYPRLGVTTSSIHQQQKATGLVVPTSGNIAFGAAVEGGVFTSNGANIAEVDSKYQRIAVQKAGSGLIASAAFCGIALLENKQPDGFQTAFHTQINNTSTIAEFYPQDDVPILEKGRIWVKFDAPVISLVPRTLVINYITTGLLAGTFTTGAGTLAPSVILLTPTTVDEFGNHCGLVAINLP